MTLVSQQQFAAFAPRCVALTGWAAALDSACQKYGIDTPDRVAYFMATLYEETGGFTVFVENLNYTAAELVRVWPSCFNAASAAAYAEKPQEIANFVYANRDGNGNAASNDGWTYRGRGPMQVTFRDGYAAATKATGLDLVNDPDLMLTPQGGAVSAAEFWQRAGCNVPADAGDLAGVTRIVNGGLTNLPARAAALNRWRSVVESSPAAVSQIPAPAPLAPAEAPAPPPSVAQVIEQSSISAAPPNPNFTALENTLHVILAAVVPVFGSLIVLFLRWRRAQQAARAAPSPAP